MMNPEVKQIWLNALRSGEYIKTEGSLFRRNRQGQPTHCAIGVLCEEAARAGVIEIDEIDTAARGGLNRFPAPPADHIMPTAVANWAGITDFENEEMPVIKVNDDYSYPGSTFEDVADHIEREL